jgi:hypothetical protein
MQTDYLEVPFETEKEEATPPFVLLPRDRYEAEIIEAKAGPTKTGLGYGVTLKWSILTEGDFKHRILTQMILLQHDNEDAQKFGRQRFKDVLVAVGIKENVEDLSVMLHMPALISVVIRQDKNGQYPDRNEINMVKPIPLSHNGPTREAVHEAIREAQKPQQAFKPVHSDMNDQIRF